MQYSKGRLKYPLKQKSKGSGEWERISWEQAYSEIANKLIDTKEQEGNLLSVCLAKNFGNVGLLNNSVEGFFRSIGYVTFMYLLGLITYQLLLMNQFIGALQVW